MHFTKAQLINDPGARVISPMKLSTLVFDEYFNKRAVIAFFVPALTEVTVKRAGIERAELDFLVSLCPTQTCM